MQTAAARQEEVLSLISLALTRVGKEALPQGKLVAARADHALWNPQSGTALLTPAAQWPWVSVLTHRASVSSPIRQKQWHLLPDICPLSRDFQVPSGHAWLWQLCLLPPASCPGSRGLGPSCQLLLWPRCPSCPPLHSPLSLCRVLPLCRHVWRLEPPARDTLSVVLLAGSPTPPGCSMPSGRHWLRKLLYLCPPQGRRAPREWRVNRKRSRSRWQERTSCCSPGLLTRDQGGRAAPAGSHSSLQLTIPDEVRDCW